MISLKQHDSLIMPNFLTYLRLKRALEGDPQLVSMMTALFIVKLSQFTPWNLALWFIFSPYVNSDLLW